MRVAVVHYHLRPGGVTRVIARAVDAVRRHGIRTAVLSGEPGAAEVAADAVCPQLAYDEPASAPGFAPDPEAIRAAARTALGGAPDLWHIHNHSLGKNVALPRLVAALARRGEALLLQVHDFAEDGRAENYRRLRAALGGEGMAALYPAGPRVRYALLNRRDRDILAGAGAPPDACLRLPNPVEAPPRAADAQPEEDAPPLILYPTRAIRRKNLGELLLWAAFQRDAARFATTLAPENPEARPIHDRWVALARELGLPVAFGLGDDGSRSFGALLGAARATITTSVAEGFGLAFLEPWAAGLPVVGRDLPEITADFAGAGVRLDGLYARLDVPATWIDRTELRRRIGDGLRRARGAFGLDCTAADADRAFEAALSPGGIDFGRLDESMQAAVIRRVAGDAGAREEWTPAGLPLETAAGQEAAGLVAANAAAVAEAFSVAHYGERLADIYRALVGAPAGPFAALDPAAVLAAFADPSRFCLLRSA